MFIEYTLKVCNLLILQYSDLALGVYPLCIFLSAILQSSLAVLLPPRLLT